jgi:uncharacterized protein YjcR
MAEAHKKFKEYVKNELMDTNFEGIYDKLAIENQYSLDILRRMVLLTMYQIEINSKESEQKYLQQLSSFMNMLGEKKIRKHIMTSQLLHMVSVCDYINNKGESTAHLSQYM